MSLKQPGKKQGARLHITGSKGPEKTLIEERHLLLTLMDNLPDLIYFKDRESRFTRINLALAKVFNLNHPSQAVGKTDFDFFRTEHAQQAYSDEQEIIRTGQPMIGIEEKQTWPDGRENWVSTTKMPLRDAREAIIGTFGVSRDITERKRAEEALRQSERKYRQLHERMMDGFVRVDLGGRIVEANDAFCNMLGYTPEELLKLTFADLTPEKWQVLETDIMEEMVLTRGYSEVYFKECRRKSGAIIPLELRSYVLLDESGNACGTWAIVRDITLRRWAEEMLQEYEKVVEGSDEMIAVVDRNYDYVLANRAYLDQCGLKREEVVGSSIAEVLGEEFFARTVKEKLDECFQGNVVRYEMKYNFRELGDRDTLASYIPIEGFRGIDRAACFLQDITEHKRAEKALMESEERYRTLFENAPVGIYRTTPAGRIAAANPAPVRMLGYSSFDELSRRDLNAGSFEPDYPRTQFMEMVEQRGEVSGLESAWRKKNGEVLHVRENARAIGDDTGKILYYEGTVEDVTERKRAEAEHVRLVTAIEQSAEAVVMTNTHGAIEYVNPAFTRITGYSREEALGQNPRILKSDKQDPKFYQELWETILKGQNWRGELVNRRKDGSLYTEQMNIAAVRGTLGEVTHFIAIKEDVTERKALEAQLHQMAKVEAVGRLAGGVAHDFNNLLTVINGYSGLLLDLLGTENKTGAYLQEIKNAGERAASLTRQLLAFSRRQIMVPQVLDLNAVVANLEKMLRRLIGEDIELRTVLDPALGRVQADQGQIEQVIMNLAVNARDAMPSGGSLTLETRNVDLDEAYAHTHPTVKPGPHVMLAVADTGVGMTPETLAHLFEPFFTTKERGKGTGLGLATVYGIVKQSGGSIWAYSEPGQGAVMKVYFPLVSGSQAAKEPAMPEQDTASGSETILVVEDEEGVRSMIRVALESAGYRVLEVADAQKAMATCTNHDGFIHLLLTDVVMPQMSGPLVAEQVIALRPDIKVLYMSGYTDDAIVHHGVLSQDMPFIQKPFSPRTLRKKVREVLSGK